MDMPFELKFVLNGNLILEVFYFLIHKFDDQSTVHANQMVMMRTIDFRFIAGSAVTQIHFTGKTVVYQNIHSSVNGGTRYMLSPFFQRQVDFFTFPMPSVFDNFLQDRSSLRGIL